MYAREVFVIGAILLPELLIVIRTPKRSHSIHRSEDESVAKAQPPKSQRAELPRILKTSDVAVARCSTMPVIRSECEAHATDSQT